MPKDKMFPQAIDFDGEIHVIDWMTNKLLYSLPVDLGLEVMLRSTRWDNAHATAQVRILAADDRITANRHPKGPEPSIGAQQPIYFTQCKVENREMY